MRKVLALATTALVGALIASTTAHADQRFLKAAAFFLSGGDNGLKYSVLTDKTEAVGSEPMGVVVYQDKNKPCTVHYINFIDQKLRIANGGSNLLTAATVDFDRMPSPRDFGSSYTSGVGGTMMSWIANLPAHAMIETTVKHEKDDSLSFPVTGKHWKTFSWFDTNANGSGLRRLMALDFIRNNYCAGLPEVRGY
jgi:hypothetical protein